MVLMVNSTDNVTGKEGLTLTITASKDGGVFNVITPTVTERGNGWYNLALTISHTDNLGDYALHITGVGADPSDVISEIIAYDPQDAVSLGLSRLDVAVGTRALEAGGNISAILKRFTGGRGMG